MKQSNIVEESRKKAWYHDYNIKKEGGAPNMLYAMISIAVLGGAMYLTR